MSAYITNGEIAAYIELHRVRAIAAGASESTALTNAIDSACYDHYKSAKVTSEEARNYWLARYGA